MKITVIDIFLVFISIISFVSSENYRSSSASSSSTSPSSTSSSTILSSLTLSSDQQSSLKEYNNHHNNRNKLSSPTIRLNNLPRQQLKNIAKRFLKRFQVDLSTINGPSSSPFLASSSPRKHHSIDLNNKPTIDSLPSSPSPKLLSIDLSVLDKPLTIPMVYYDDLSFLEDLSFPRDSRSNEIEDNYYLNNHNNYNSINSHHIPNEESTDYNSYYVDNDDDMPNEIPLDPVYLDEDRNDWMINDQYNQHQPHLNQFDYHLSNLDQFPDHLSTGNDALSDYLHDLRLSTTKQFEHNHQQLKPSAHQAESVDNQFQKFGFPNSIVDLFPTKSNNYFNLHHEPLTSQQLANWFPIDEPDLPMNNFFPSDKTEVNQNDVNYYQHGIFPLKKGLIVDKSILPNQKHLHHHQHQLPITFKSPSTTGHENNDKTIKSQSNLGPNYHQSVYRATDLVNDKPIK